MGPVTIQPALQQHGWMISSIMPSEKYKEKLMRIAMISTYPPIECGIATYSENLCNAFHKEENEIVVISQHGAHGPDVFPVYNAADDNICCRNIQYAQ